MGCIIYNGPAPRKRRVPQVPFLHLGFLSFLIPRSPAAAGPLPPPSRIKPLHPNLFPFNDLQKILDNDYTFAVTYLVSSALQLAVSLLLPSTLLSLPRHFPPKSASLTEHPTRMRTLHLRVYSARRIPRSILTIANSAPGGRDLSSELTPVESTLVKVYQNKELQLPLESTLTKNRGEGGSLWYV
jgi:hypothetical protein